jgi:catechol 2,3-dioxygenase-like lactoylglutathione lyase family enzyme
VKHQLKAIVLKTPRLKETLAFFTDQLGFTINESSPTHFVIHAEGVRILFVASDSGQAVEFYLHPKSAKDLCVLKDPNLIKIIVC